MICKRVLFTAAVMAVVVACSPKTLIVRQMTALVDGGITVFERDSDLDLLEKAIPANIKLMEAMLANSPSDDRLATLIARLYGSYGLGFVETRLESARLTPLDEEANPSEIAQLKEQLNHTYEKGMRYALDVLEQRKPGARPAIAKVATIEPYLSRLGKGDAAPLFWYGFNLGAWVNNNLDSIRAVSRAHVARKVMQRVLELDPDYHNGGAHLFMMTYFGSRPPMMGGNQAKARGHYAEIKRIAGVDYLLADLFYARFCLHQQQNREEFIAIMQKIIDHPQVEDNKALYNAIAVKRAGIYLAAVDVFFE